MKIVEQFARKAVDQVVLQLPFPPSVNRLWRKGPNGMFRSERYRTWIRAAGNELVAQRPGRVRGAFSIVVLLGRPDRRRRDADNALKAVLDLLEQHRVIDDDAQQQRTAVEWSDSVVGALVTVTAWKAEAGRAAA